MSDHDYGLLVEAVGWIEQHAGVDGPSYPDLERLISLVGRISPSGEPRQTNRSPLPLSPASADSSDVDGLFVPRRSDYHHWRSIIERTVDTRCLECGAKVALPDQAGRLACAACGLVMDISTIASVRRVPTPDTSASP